ncbi:hypothetical protein D9758_000415 [Tetrapyrgos nigripes]|uniref:4a-hydroxytetrahydrobiopterin dehydratase n=1 Tax=Tetrapyrgos nigripes TaxID=182062 RepID=A0A8H5LZD2_9AGAR|nr:hypothetical protein D9758_000415 [Tetrapyrgos nigripes]
MFRHIARYFTTEMASKSFLPPLPPKISGWPTPWLTLEEMEQYLIPLQEAAKWQIPTDCRPISLQRSFSFTNGPSALKYMREVIDIANTERHHPSILRYQDTPSPRVDISIHTHSATAPPKLFAEVSSAYAGRCATVLAIHDLNSPEQTK